jgi:hypothetical protein
MSVESQESSGPAPLAESEVDIIEATKAWELEGNTDNRVIMSTIDTGVRVTYQDLKDNFLGVKDCLTLIWAQKSQMTRMDLELTPPGYFEDKVWIRFICFGFNYSILKLI